MLTVSIAAAWALFVLGWGTLLAAAFRVRIAKRYRLARYTMAAIALAYLWWQDALPDPASAAFILATISLMIAGWVAVLRR